MSITVNTHEAKTRLSELLALTERGEDVIIARAGKPVARLVPANVPGARRRIPGSLKGKILMSDDFDAPLPPEVLALFLESRIEPPLRGTNSA